MWWFCALLMLVYYLVLDRKVWHLLRQPLLQALCVGALLALCVLWQLKAQLPDLPPVHFLGITTVALLLGLRLTILVIPMALLLPQLAALLLHQPVAELNAILLQWTALTLVALQSYGCYLLASHKLPQHMFVAIFVSGFLNGLLSALTFVALLALGFFGVLAVGESSQISDFLLVMPLLAMPEALLNGMALTLLLVYKPHWVAAYRQT
ncbi:energy-coupling factor ABC transporter permease [Rheinheimera texasensis]|jgi:uncharacterized membrane protein|uniref:energy-coupling factor ABC transporter permease n=1 Tax=Rheinheimera texasensis TaxID=306205 RepID=UPI0004E1B52A|nr:energy-coupling factor ABC transporter permease [Rheinheimera texasensis]